MSFTLTSQNGRRIISAKEDIVFSNASQMAELLSQQVAAGHKLIILDFTKASLIDSAGICGIVGELAKLKENKVTLILAGCNSTIHKVFQLVGLDRLFTIVRTLEEALEDPA